MKVNTQVFAFSARVYLFHGFFMTKNGRRAVYQDEQFVFIADGDVFPRVFRVGAFTVVFHFPQDTLLMCE